MDTIHPMLTPTPLFSLYPDVQFSGHVSLPRNFQVSRKLALAHSSLVDMTVLQLFRWDWLLLLLNRLPAHPAVLSDTLWQFKCSCLDYIISWTLDICDEPNKVPGTFGRQIATTSFCFNAKLVLRRIAIAEQQSLNLAYVYLRPVYPHSMAIWFAHFETFCQTYLSMVICEISTDLNGEVITNPSFLSNTKHFLADV